MTEQELKDVALMIVQVIHIYAMQGKTWQERSDNATSAIVEFRNDMGWMRRYPYTKSKLLLNIANCVEEIGKENGYWE